MRSVLPAAVAATILALTGILPLESAAASTAADAARVSSAVTLTATKPASHETASARIVEGANNENSLVASEVDAALAALSPRVGALSHSDALRYAFRAYYKYRSARPDQVAKPYLYFVDFGLDSYTPRGYVFDMNALQVVEGPFTVAHGHGSEVGGSAVPGRFLNVKDSNTTSLGLYLAQETYNFTGRASGRAYRSIGLRLRGVSGSFNDAARRRGIVVHGAPYVTSSKAGRSAGCPAMEHGRAQRLIPMLANGGLVFHFSPRDTRWMSGDPWAA